MADLEKKYSTIAEDYDKMINWNKRLAREIPFFTNLLSEVQGKKILDCACATGRHAVNLARLGYQVTGSDVNPNMLGQAEKLSKIQGVNVNFLQSDFLNLTRDIKEKFNLVMCIGNSLPHVENTEELKRSLQNMFDLLQPNGILVIQNRNYDKLIMDKFQLMPLTNWNTNGEQKLFIRINEVNNNQKVSFTILTLTESNNNWRMDAERTELYPIQQNEIEKLLIDIGFAKTAYYGDYENNLFNPSSSGDLIIVAVKN